VITDRAAEIVGVMSLSQTYTEMTAN